MIVARLRREDGYTAVELLTVTLILAVVLTGLTGLFVSGSKAQLDQNSRFQAQQEARVAVDTLKRDVHCAQAATPATTASLLVLTDPCAGSGTVSWCTAPIAGTSRFGLYRSATAACSASSTKYSKYLTAGNAFSYTQQSSQSLASVHVDLRVNRRPPRPGTYELVDDVVLRNSSRLCVVGSASTIASPKPPC